MEITLSHLNNCSIHIPDMVSTDIQKPLVPEFFETPYPNLLILAKKKSGKTTVIYNIIERALARHGDKRLKFLCFCPTINKASVWQAIKELLDRKGVDYTASESFIQSTPSYKNNRMIKKNILLDLEEMLRVIDGDDTREFIIILDDLASACRNDILGNLMKRNRHFKITIICSIQSTTDLLPTQWSQVDYCLIFRNIPDTKLRKVYDNLSISIPYDEFKSIYTYATHEPYSFLYYDRNEEKFRKNMDTAIDLSGEGI